MLLELAKSQPVISGGVVFDIGFLQDLVNGLVDLVIFKNAGDLIQPGHEHETAHLSEAFLQGIQHVEHEAGG